MKRPSYRAAIDWLAHNDDNEWLKEEPSLHSVTACLVADLFGISEDRVAADLRRAVKKRDDLHRARIDAKLHP